MTRSDLVQNINVLERLHGIILMNLEAVVWCPFCLDAQKFLLGGEEVKTVGTAEKGR